MEALRRASKVRFTDHRNDSLYRILCSISIRVIETFGFQSSLPIRTQNGGIGNPSSIWMSNAVVMYPMIAYRPQTATTSTRQETP